MKSRRLIARVMVTYLVCAAPVVVCTRFSNGS
jgi:hypothetical protein